MKNYLRKADDFKNVKLFYQIYYFFNIDRQTFTDEFDIRFSLFK